MKLEALMCIFPQDNVVQDYNFSRDGYVAALTVINEQSKLMLKTSSCVCVVDSGDQRAE